MKLTSSFMLILALLLAAILWGICFGLGYLVAG